MKKCISLLLAASTMLLFSNCHPNVGAGTTPKGVDLHVGNIFLFYGPDPTTSDVVSFKVKIKVETLDANHNAVQYKPTVVVNYSSSQNNQGILDIPGIEVPSSGDFTVEVWEEATSCHWQDSHCFSNPYPHLTQNSYFSQQTFHAPVSSIVFNATFTLDDWNCC